MVTYKALERFLEKCKDTLPKVEREIRSAQEHLRFLEDSRVAIMAQIQTLEELMDVENNQPAVELPVGEDALQELFDKRLGDPELPGAKEMRSMRQEGVYKREAMAAVETLDEINQSAGSGQDADIDPS